MIDKASHFSHKARLIRRGLLLVILQYFTLYWSTRKTLLLVYSDYKFWE